MKPNQEINLIIFFLKNMMIIVKYIISEDCVYTDKTTTEHYCYTKYTLSEEQKAVDSLEL